MNTTKLRPIDIQSFSGGAAVAGTVPGAVVVIDVFRAFTTAAVALSRGARAIVMVDELERALELRERGVGRYCMGERGGVKPEGFDFGNSPLEFAPVDFEDEVLIQTTSNGTRGIAATAAAGADCIYAGAFVTAEATVGALLACAPDETVTLVAMGQGDRIRSDEDELCALYLRGRLEGRVPDKRALIDALRSLLGKPGTTERLFGSLSAADIDYCLSFDRFSFAVRVQAEGDLLVARAGSPVNLS